LIRPRQCVDSGKPTHAGWRSGGRPGPVAARDEFDRRLRIFGANHFGISLTITLHGVEFRAVVAPPLQPTDGSHWPRLDTAMLAALEPDRG
jgi:hypothetical protein